MSRQYLSYWPFSKAIKKWPVRSAAIRRHLTKHDICPECGADAPSPKKACSECDWVFSDSGKKRQTA